VCAKDNNQKTERLWACPLSSNVERDKYKIHVVFLEGVLGIANNHEGVILGDIEVHKSIA